LRLYAFSIGKEDVMAYDDSATKLAEAERLREQALAQQQAAQEAAGYWAEVEKNRGKADQLRTEAAWYDNEATKNESWARSKDAEAGTGGSGFLGF
jgi:hypothetical protein